MILSELSVKRPVFATVISLLLVILGLMAMRLLPVREYPDISRPFVSIDIAYRGASAEVMERQVTRVLEEQMAGIPGLETLTSQSRDEHAEINMEFSLDTNVDVAANDVRARLGRVRDNLPLGAEAPEIRTAESGAQTVMWLTLTSQRMDAQEITDYLERYVVDRLSTVAGVSQVQLAGARRYSIRVWLDRQALAARQLTVEDVADALRVQNVDLPAGRLESTEREFTLRTASGFTEVQDFRELVIGRGPNGLVRLAEVAEVELGAENLRSISHANGEAAVSLSVTPQSKANPVAVSKGLHQRLAQIRPTLPEGMHLNISFDRAEFIDASIHEVYIALGVSMLMVLVVMYLFLGTLRATLIPAVVVPISLLASFTVMAGFGYSLNVLTLLGLVLAIGLVVDDAIVVLENIYRRIEEGQRPLLAALDGSREIAFAVVATTLVLVAAFVPISYMQGDVGRLFSEFGITVAAAVLFSALVALTLTPMMASRMFQGPGQRSGFAHWVDRSFRRVAGRYEQALRSVVVHPWRMLCVGAMVMVAAALLFRILPSAYAPPEDRGMVRMFLEAPEGASMDYTMDYLQRVEAGVEEYVEAGLVEQYTSRVPGSWDGNAVDTARLRVMLVPWHQRERNAEQIAADMREHFASLPGVKVSVYASGGLGGGGGDQPLEVVLGGPDYPTLTRWSEDLMAHLRALPGFTDVQTNFEQRKPQMRVAIDRDRAADLGVSVAAVGTTLQAMLGGSTVTTFDRGGEEYEVILQGKPQDRASPSDLKNLYVRSSVSGDLVPLASVVSLTETAGAALLEHYNQLRSIKVSAGLTPGYSLGQAVDVVNDYAAQQLPATIQLSYDGEAKDYLESGLSLYFTLGLALVIVYLVLAANFESFIHPLVIMSTVPLAITGGLIGLWIWGLSINIFSQIGAILLVGLAAKNGVLIVEFANQLRDRGSEFHDALVEAAGIRLRPVVMTSLAAAFGALPLVLATGPGSEGRLAVGVTVFCGVIFATFLTLFIVPAFYALIARNTRSPHHVARMVERLRRESGHAEPPQPAYAATGTAPQRSNPT